MRLLGVGEGLLGSVGVSSPCFSLWTQQGLTSPRPPHGVDCLPCWLPARRLRAAPGTFPRLPAGHLHLLPGQVQAPQVQQHLHLPRLGLWHWLAHGPVLHALHPALGLHQGVEDGGDTAGGEQPGRRGQEGRLRGGGYSSGQGWQCWEDWCVWAQPRACLGPRFLIWAMGVMRTCPTCLPGKPGQLLPGGYSSVLLC